jgi:hypothetical protein
MFDLNFTNYFNDTVLSNFTFSLNLTQNYLASTPDLKGFETYFGELLRFLGIIVPNNDLSQAYNPYFYARAMRSLYSKTWPALNLSLSANASAALTKAVPNRTIEALINFLGAQLIPNSTNCKLDQRYAYQYTWDYDFTPIPPLDGLEAYLGTLFSYLGTSNLQQFVPGALNLTGLYDVIPIAKPVFDKNGIQTWRDFAFFIGQRTGALSLRLQRNMYQPMQSSVATPYCMQCASGYALDL